MNRALIVAAALLFSAAAMAQAYKWTDQNGRVQYGDAPPPGVKATPLRSVPGPATQPAAAVKKDDAKAAKKGPLTPAEQEAEFRRRQQEADKDRQKQAQAQQEADGKRENCTRAQEMLRSLGAGRVSRTDAKGERYYLDEAQVAQETAKAQQAVQQWCS